MGKWKGVQHVRRSGWLYAILAAGLILIPSLGKAQSVGRLYFLDRATGLQTLGTIDFPGQYQQSRNSTLPELVGADIVTSTAAGLLVYTRATGAGRIIRLGADGVPDYGTRNIFARTWQKMVSLGDYLFFYDNRRSAAIGYISPDGRFVLTQSLLNSLSPWTHILATENYLLFYNQNTGVIVTGSITPSGQFVQTARGNAGTGFDYLVNSGDRIILYNQASGKIQSGQIRAIAGNAQLTGRYQITGAGVVAAGFSSLEAQNGHVVLYNADNGQMNVLGFDQSGKYTVTQQLNILRNWTTLVSTGNYLLLYNNVSGGAAAGYISDAGIFVNTQPRFILGRASFAVATRR